jgi:hypothetical protein
MDGGAGWPEALQAGAAIVQAVLLPIALYFAYRTVSEASGARREEADRFRAEQEDDRKRRRAEAAKARQADLERRLENVVRSVMTVEDLRYSSKAGSEAAYFNLPVARRRLETAIIATGMDLPKTSLLVQEKPGGFHSESEAADALAELSESLRIFATAARAPFEGE